MIHTPHGQDLLDAVPARPRRAAPPTGPWPTSSTTPWPTSGPRSVTGRAICGLSGGVDSAVAAALVHRAIGSQLTCVFVDTGLMRKDEGDQVVETFRRHQGIELIHVRAGGPLLRPPGRRHRARGEAQGHRRAVHPGLRGRQGRHRGRPLPGPGHPVPRRDRVRDGPRLHHQEPPQRGRPARRPRLRAGRAPAHPVQGRGARRRARAGPARRDRLAPAVPGSRPGRADHRRGDPRQGGAAPGGRRHRPRGAPHRRAGPGDLAGLRRAARHPHRRACRATSAPTATR